MSNDIAFRRINGRIIPIRLNKQKKEQIKGIGIAAAGVAVAVESGQIFKKISFRAINKAIESKEILSNISKPGEFTGIKHKFKSSAQMNFDDVLRVNSSSQAAKTMASAKIIGKIAQRVRKYSPFVAGALIGYGTTKFLANYNKDKKKSLSPEFIAAIGATTATAGAWGAKNAEAIFAASVNRGRQGAFQMVGEGILGKLKAATKGFVKAKF